MTESYEYEFMIYLHYHFNYYTTVQPFLYEHCLTAYTYSLYLYLINIPLLSSHPFDFPVLRFSIA